MVTIRWRFWKLNQILINICIFGSRGEGGKHNYVTPDIPNREKEKVVKIIENQQKESNEYIKSIEKKEIE